MPNPDPIQPRNVFEQEDNCKTCNGGGTIKIINPHQGGFVLEDLCPTCDGSGRKQA